MSTRLGGIGLGTVAGLVGGGGLVAGLYESIKVAGDAAREQKKLGVILDSTGAMPTFPRNKSVPSVKSCKRRPTSPRK